MIFRLRMCFCGRCSMYFSFHRSHFVHSFSLSLSFALVHSFNNSFFRYSIQTLLQTSDELKVGVMPIIELYHLFNIFRAVFCSRIEIIPQNFHQYGFAILSFYSRCVFNLFVLRFFRRRQPKRAHYSYCCWVFVRFSVGLPTRLINLHQLRFIRRRCFYFVGIIIIKFFLYSYR